MCGHNGLKLDKPGVMKYISKAAWDALVVSSKGDCLPNAVSNSPGRRPHDDVASVTDLSVLTRIV